MKSDAMPVSFQHMCLCSAIESVHLSEPSSTIWQKAIMSFWRNTAILHHLRRANIFLYIASSLIVVLTGCTSLSHEEREFLSTATQDLARLKSDSEQWASRIKADFKKGSSSYETAYTKYIPAKAAVESWLDRLSEDLTTHNHIGSSKNYQSSLEQASAKAEDFVHYAHSLYKKSLAPALVALLPVLETIGEKIYAKYENENSKTIKEMTGFLQSLKWKSFDQI